MNPYDPSDVGLLVLRVVLGLTMAAHGYNKFFGGGRIPGTAGWFDSIGMKPGLFHAGSPRPPRSPQVSGWPRPAHTDPRRRFRRADAGRGMDRAPKNGFFIVKEGWEYNLVLAAAAVAGARWGASSAWTTAVLRTSMTICTAGAGWRSRWGWACRLYRPARHFLPSAGQGRRLRLLAVGAGLPARSRCVAS